MNHYLREFAGDRADRFSQMWREKQLEYSFRRGLMRAYQPFSLCTRDALVYTERALGVNLDSAARDHLLAQYRRLPAFADTVSGLQELRRGGNSLFAFSNGEEDAIRALLRESGILELITTVVSVDEVKSFKPDPAVYHHMIKRAGYPAEQVWLVSSNPFDVIGARAAGLHAAWIKRTSAAVYDPWDLDPNLTVPDLLALARHLNSSGAS